MLNSRLTKILATNRPQTTKSKEQNNIEDLNSSYQSYQGIAGRMAIIEEKKNKNIISRMTRNELDSSVEDAKVRVFSRSTSPRDSTH